MQTGIVVSFNCERGFGFIKPSRRGARDVYVHRTGVLTKTKTLAKDQRVMFDTVQTDRGTTAVNVVEAQ